MSNDKLREALEQLMQYNVCMCEGGDSYDPLMADYHVQKACEILTEALAASKPEPQATTTNEHTERAEFEKYFVRSNRRGTKHAANALAKNEHGYYIDDSTQRHWWTWQNATKAAAMLEAQRPALKPLTDARLQGLYRYRLKANGVSDDPWYWYTSGSADTEAAHGIKEQA